MDDRGKKQAQSVILSFMDWKYGGNFIFNFIEVVIGNSILVVNVKQNSALININIHLFSGW